MKKEIDKSITQRTDEVKDIIDRMPHGIGKMVAIIVASLAALLLFFGWMIDYPEKVTGSISITARQAPVRLVANTSGKLHLLKNNNDSLKENQMIAFLENPARLEDVLEIEDYLQRHSIDSLYNDPKMEALPANPVLGELSIPYYTFLNSLQKYLNYREGQPYLKKRESTKMLLESQLQLKEFNRQQMNTNTTSLKIMGKNAHRDSLLFRSKTIAEADLERSAVTYLAKVENNQAVGKEYTNIQLQINDTRSKLQMLELEQQEAEQKLRMDLYSGYNELVNNINKWRLAYTFSSPFAGKLEYLNFWRENDFVAAGTPVLSVIPSGNPLLGQVYLPSQGAGKVLVGQEVIIRLDNYPYMEYGSIGGKVTMISALSNQTETFAKKNDIQTYLITVDLPNKLTTNYGTTLDFNYEIKGVADILTKKRKFLLRLFDNLKYIASKKTI
ncbi:MAG: HlyD family secretion protein [Bacteroidetes bacterium]|nr:HlyD family secretion protein [Bacteroidota bacterium]MCL6102961.1 HlyD family secretion protein [Bacteroidota bacterium]